MFNKLFLVIGLFALIGESYSQTLGNYTSATVMVGGNINIIPSAVPTSTVKTTVSSSTKFSGVLTAKPSTGVVSITDAKPAGIYTIKIKAFNSSGVTVTKTFTLTVTIPGCSQGNFGGNSQINAGPNQNNIAIGDFNGDSRQDLAMAHEGFNSISVRLGDGHGGFSGNTEVPVGSHPYNLAVGDFNGDGNQDIANTNQGGNIVTILIGNGSGGFSWTLSVSVGVGPVGIALGDFNNDGKQDIVTSNLNSSNISILLGNGSGGFGSSQQFTVAPFPQNVAIGDFNNDGKQDIASCSSGNSTVSIRMGNGSGSFSGTTEVPVGQNPYGIAIADYNNDGNQDIASVNYLSNTISIRTGDGFGNFNGNVEIPVGSNPYSIAAGNFNGDNNIDLIVTNFFGNNMSVRFGNGQGGFYGTTNIPVGSYPICVVVGDFNNDLKEDVAAANYFDQTVSIRMGIAGTNPSVTPYSNGPHCEGLSFQLNSYGGKTYSWTGPNGYSSTVQNPIILSSTASQSGIYTVSIVDSFSCTASGSTTVNIHAVPNASFTLTTDSLCDNDPLLALSGNPSGGIFSGPGVSSNEFSPSAAGPGIFNLTYIYTNSFGCSDSATDKMTVLLCSGIEENKTVQHNFSIYPNPVIDKFTINENAKKSNRMILYSMDGKNLREWRVESGENEFSISAFPKGIYLLKIFSDTNYEAIKIVKL